MTDEITPVPLLAAIEPVQIARIQNVLVTQPKRVGSEVEVGLASVHKRVFL
jgi:hypothetical protein